MRIDEYFDRLRAVIAACLWVQSTTLTFDQRGTYAGYVRGDLRFVDGSVLHLREYVDTELSVDRLVYAYQYMRPDGRLIFRYDNSGHHRHLNLPTYPHHKHDGNETTVVAASPPDLATVLIEVAKHVDLSTR